MWVSGMLPGRGHAHEPFVEPALRPQPVTSALGGVQRLQEGMPGYRLRMPEQVHPISAGIKGGIVGGLVIPIPALIWGLSTGHGIWYPANLLAGMVLPGVGTMSVEDLEKFHLSFLVAAGFIHVITCLVVGLVYGVLLPTLPEIPGPMAWGGLLMPLLWTGASYSLMGVVNPVLQRLVDWPWFVVSQFIFGLVASVVVVRSQLVYITPAGRGPDRVPITE